jgi:hypothetical protein
MAVRSKQRQPAPETAALLRGTDAPTHFVFEHKLFQAQGAVFRIDETNARPCLAVDLGDVVANMDLDAIASGFGIAPAGPDAAMLELVRRALGHVEQVAPGDAIPPAILDAAASWKIEPLHLIVAEGRVSHSLIVWMGGTQDERPSMGELARLADDPATKARLCEAFGALAERMGLPPSRRTEALGRVTTLAKELAYVEALRVRYGEIDRLRAKARDLHRLYRAQQETAPSKTAGLIERALTLMAGPLENVAALFQTIDGQMDATPDAAAHAMANLPSAIAAIRLARDALRIEFQRWEPQLELWRDLVPARSAKAERAALYLERFLASHYPAGAQGTPSA